MGKRQTVHDVTHEYLLYYMNPKNLELHRFRKLFLWTVDWQLFKS